MAEEKDEPGTDWGRLTAWMNRKNPNWKRVEANMRALAVKEARSARLHRLHEEKLRKMQCYEALCKEAAEWSPIITKDPTAIHRMPDTFESAPFPSNKHLFQLAARRQSPVPRWPAPCPSPSPSPSSNTKEQPFFRFKKWPPSPSLPWSELIMEPLLLPPPQPRWEKYSEEEIQGLNMILVAALEEMRDLLPPESNPRRWFEAMLQYKPSS